MDNFEKYKKVNHIGKKLKEALDNNHISVDQMAKETGINRSLLFDYIKERRNPSDETLQKIADYFSLPIEYFTQKFYYKNANTFVFIPKIRNQLFNGEQKAQKSKNKKEHTEIHQAFDLLYSNASDIDKCLISDKFYENIDRIIAYMSGSDIAMDSEDASDETKTIAKRLKWAIDASEASVKQIAEEAGVHQVLIQEYLAARRNPSESTLNKLIDALNLPSDYFTADIVKVGNAFVLDILPKGSTQEVSYQPSKSEVADAAKIYNQSWDVLDSLYKKSDESHKEKINQFLHDQYFDLLKLTSEKNETSS